MKINCDSCGAKYTIADEKVRGRTVKIRCKKCSGAIVIKGPDRPAAPAIPTGKVAVKKDSDDSKTAGDSRSSQYAERISVSPNNQFGDSPNDQHDNEPDDQLSDDWTVALVDGSQRTGSIAELAELFRAGKLALDGYVWKEGMANWQSLEETPELLDQLTSQHDSSPPRLVPQEVGGSGAAIEAGLFGSPDAQQSARVDRRDEEQDLFGGERTTPDDPTEEVATSAPERFSAKPTGAKFTAERSENSVLFTVDALMAVGNKPARKTGAADDDKVDFKAISTSASTPPPLGSLVDYNPFDLPTGSNKSRSESLTNSLLPATGIDESGSNTNKGSGKSGRGLVIALGAAVSVLIVVCIIFGVILLSKDPAATATATPTTDIDQSERTQARSGSDDTSNKAARSGEDTNTAPSDQPATAATDKSAESSGAKTASTRTPGPLPSSTAKSAGTTTKDTPPPATTTAQAAPAKTEEKKPTPPAETAAAAAPGAPGPFDRGAAISALNAAAGQAQSCRRPDTPVGQSRMSVTFAPSGKAQTVTMSGAHAGTPIEGCVVAAFKRASVPPFTGSSQTLPKSISF